MNQTISFSTNQVYAFVIILSLVFAILASPAVYLQVGNLIGNSVNTTLVQPSLTDDLDNRLVVIHAVVFGLISFIFIKYFHQIVKIN